MADSYVCRDGRGRFSRKTPLKPTEQERCVEQLEVDHNYAGEGHVCNPESTGCSVCCPGIEKLCGTNRINMDKSWSSGRRLIEWPVLFENLNHCTSCYLGPLMLSHQTVKGEMKCGLGGYIYVQCMSCLHLNRVAYGSTYKTKPGARGIPSFSVNTKLGAAMIDALGGPQKVNNVLSTLNLPTISHKNLKVMERRAGEMIEDFANKSMEKRCEEAYEAEMRDTVDAVLHTEEVDSVITDPDMQLNKRNDVTESNSIMDESNKTDETSNNRNDRIRSDSTNAESNYTDGGSNNRDMPTSANFGMTVSADHGWQKRGFDSLTGHTFLMSKRKYGNKVVKAVIKHRTCATCKWWQRNRPGRKPRPHRCVWNHRGSAKLMESRAGMEAITQMLQQGTPVKVIEGDGDNTLIARLKSELGITVTKKLDRNHSVKNIVSKLYDLQKKDKDVTLSSQVIRHLTKSLKYVFAKNQGNPEGLKENLEALVPHQFGDHSFCQPRFCGYKRKPNVKYLHRSLPYKAPLNDSVLREKLCTVFETVISKAAIYSDLGSSQSCEHAHRAASLRAPKHLHYGESESLDFRVKATAACINEGRNYLSETFRKHGLSPGSYTVPYNLKKDMEREKRQQVACLPEKKLRRLQLKEERLTSKGAFEASEGATYESGISLGDHADDIEVIPDAIPRPSFIPVLPLDDPTIIVIDLETTGLIRRNIFPHIIQIATIESKSQIRFSQYVIPGMPMSSEAENVTGIIWDGSRLYLRGKELPAVKITSVLSNLFAWLQQFCNVVLVAHNGKNFDFRVLSKAAENCNLFELFTECVVGFADSLAVFRSKFPSIKKYTQVHLAQHFCQEDYSAHNAEEDVIMLNKILKESNVSTADLLKHSYQSNSHLHQANFNKAKAKNIGSLHPLIASGVMKMTTAENIAGSDLNFVHLKTIFNRSGEDGLIATFMSKNCHGKPRVSNDKKVISSVIPKLCYLIRRVRTTHSHHTPSVVLEQGYTKEKLKIYGSTRAKVPRMIFMCCSFHEEII